MVRFLLMSHDCILLLVVLFLIFGIPALSVLKTYITEQRQYTRIRCISITQPSPAPMWDIETVNGTLIHAYSSKIRSIHYRPDGKIDVLIKL